MIITKIWERLFIKETLKVFFLFLFSFYFLYVLIDYSAHTSSYAKFRFEFNEVGLYYALIFILRMEILIPFALLIATIKTLSSLNIHNELVAMMASGVKLKILLRPFLHIALFFTLLMYLNTEVLLPFALEQVKKIEDHYFRKYDHSDLSMEVQSLHLDDGGIILYKEYDTAKNQLFDAYWIRSFDEIYHSKYLFPFSPVPEGHFVEQLVRNDKGELLVVESFKSKEFSDLQVNKKSFKKKLTPVQQLSLSKLTKEISADYQNQNQAQLLTAFYFKLFMPWLCLLAVIAPAPFCLQFTRQLPLFLIYICGIFGLVAFYLIINASVILGEGQVIPPFLSIFLPFSISFGFFGWKFARI
jgi:lipopolysaccharide export system permease protein